MKQKIIYGIGEVLMRLETQKSLSENLVSFDVNFGGAELNTIIALSGFGNSTSFVSLLPNSFLGSQILRQIQSYNINTSKIHRAKGDQGIYYLEKRNGSFASDITYQRSNSVFAKNTNELMSINFGTKGDILHISGISLLISQKSNNVILKYVKEAKAKGMKLSFDFNYRSNLASYRIAKSRYQELLKYADIIFATKKDFVKIFDYDKNMKENEIFSIVSKKYCVETIAHTNRTIVGNNHTIQAIIYQNNKLYTSERFHFKIVDRIGGGDAFAAGVLHGIIHAMPISRILSLSLKATIYAQTICSDHIYISEKSLINAFDKINLDIQR